jgi:alkylation response protein AidB-like acyl-CoA dehydrogenase
VHFAFTEDQELLRSTTRKFLEQRQSLEHLRAHLEDSETVDRSVWQDGASLGWTAMLIPETHDGGSVTNQPVVDLVALSEELGRQLYSGPLLETNVVAFAIATTGSPEQQLRFLGPIARGESIATWCVSTNGAPSMTDVGVVGIEEPNVVSLNGSALFVCDAHIADVAMVHATSTSGPLVVMVPMNAPGVTVRVLHGLDLTRRFCEVRFENVAVDTDNIIARGAAATRVFDRCLQLATVIQSAESTGAAEHLFELTVQYLKDRVQFGRAIASFQAIKHRLADLHVTVEAMRAASRYAALAFADNASDCDEAVAVAGSYTREATSFVCGEALQLHGGIGFTWEHHVHLFLRRAKTDEGLYGEPAWHREKLCALTLSSATTNSGARV